MLLTAPAASFPHTRGGGPSPDWIAFSGDPFSPHAWGWTGVFVALGADYIVFPTRVGVDRPRASAVTSVVCFPHTRGGGPPGM